MKSLLHRVLRLAASLSASLALSTALAAPVQINIDTAGLGATEGFLELQLSATSGVGLVQADITGLVGFTLSSLQAADSWGYALLPGGYRLRNDTPNDLLHAVQFGSVLSFVLDLTGVADSGYTTVFTASLWDTSFAALGNASQQNSSVLQFNWEPNAQGGGALVTAYQASQVDVGVPQTPQALSEPSTALLSLPALALLLGVRRRNISGRRILR
jgi:hypothetical protein